MVCMKISKEDKKTVKIISSATKKKIEISNTDKRGKTPNLCLVEDGKITKLRLVGERPKKIGEELPGPKVKIPNEIGDLRGLKKLVIENMVFDVLPETIGQLTNLLEIDLNGTTITQLPNSIGNFTELRKFYLRSSKCQTIPDSVGKWRNVQEVLIHSSETSLLPPTIRNWVNVEIVQLRNCKFEEIPLGICGWRNIQRLWLHTNPLMRREDGKLVREAQSWGLNGYSEIVGPGIPVLLRNLYQRYISKYPNDVFEFQENPEWEHYNGVFQNRNNYIQWLLQNVSKYELLHYGDVFKELEMYDIARLFYLKILQTENSSNAKMALMEIDERNLYPAEKEQLYQQRAAEGGIYESTWLVKLADVKVQLQKLSEAIQIREKVAQKIPKNLENWFYLGKYYMANNNNGKAKNCFAKALELLPGRRDSKITINEVQELIKRVS